MKLLLVLLVAVAYQAYANPMDRERIREYLSASCPGRCVSQDKYKQFAIQKGLKLKAFNEKLAAGERPDVSEILDVSKFDEHCTAMGELETCVNACNEAGEEEKKTKALNMVTKAKAIVCDAEIKAAAPCLVTVANTPNAQCDTQCSSFIQSLKAAMAEYKSQGAESRDWNKAKEAGTNICKLINCRLTCRKSDIVAQCQESGYEAAKKLVRTLGDFAQTSHAQYRPPENYPDACKADQLLQNA